jgi:hypothetical protein
MRVEQSAAPGTVREIFAPPVPVDPPTVMEMLRVLRRLIEDGEIRPTDRVRFWWLRLLLRNWRGRGHDRRPVFLSRRYLRRLFVLVDRCPPARDRRSLLTLLNLMLLDTIPTRRTGTRVTPGG